MILLRKIFALVAGSILLFVLLVIGSLFYGVVKVYLWPAEKRPTPSAEEPRP